MGVKPASEAGFQRTLVAFAELHGWLTYHNPDSRRSSAGFPDLVLLRRGVLVFAELKSPRGRLRAAQRLWLAELDAVSVNAAGEPVKAVRVFRWRPEDWPAIEEVLR